MRGLVLEPVSITVLPKEYQSAVWSPQYYLTRAELRFGIWDPQGFSMTYSFAPSAGLVYVCVTYGVSFLTGMTSSLHVRYFPWPVRVSYVVQENIRTLEVPSDDFAPLLQPRHPSLPTSW